MFSDSVHDFMFFQFFSLFFFWFCDQWRINLSDCFFAGSSKSHPLGDGSICARRKQAPSERGRYHSGRKQEVEDCQCLHHGIFHMGVIQMSASCCHHVVTPGWWLMVFLWGRKKVVAFDFDCTLTSIHYFHCFARGYVDGKVADNPHYQEMVAYCQRKQFEVFFQFEFSVFSSQNVIVVFITTSVQPWPNLHKGGFRSSALGMFSGKKWLRNATQFIWLNHDYSSDHGIDLGKFMRGGDIFR